MKKTWILLCALAALLVAAWAAAACPYPSGSSGSASWPAQTYITGVAVSSNNSLDVTACDIGGTFCATSTINFNGKVVFAYDTAPGAVDAHAFVGSLAKPLRKFEVEMGGADCRYAGSVTPCMKFSGDVTSGDLANRGRILMVSGFGYPTAYGSIEAPVGYGFTKFAGMGASYPQSMRTYSNSAAHGLTTGSWTFFMSQSGCP